MKIPAGKRTQAEFEKLYLAARDGDEAALERFDAICRELGLGSFQEYEAVGQRRIAAQRAIDEQPVNQMIMARLRQPEVANDPVLSVLRDLNAEDFRNAVAANLNRPIQIPALSEHSQAQARTQPGANYSDYEAARHAIESFVDRHGLAISDVTLELQKDEWGNQYTDGVGNGYYTVKTYSGQHLGDLSLLAAQVTAYEVSRALHSSGGKGGKQATKKRRRALSPEKLNEVKKVLERYVGGTDLSVLTGPGRPDAKTVRRYMGPVLETLDVNTRSDWVKVLTTLGEKKYLGKFR